MGRPCQLETSITRAFCGTKIPFSSHCVLAFYLLWRFHIAHEPLPDFNSRKTWYRTRLIPGRQEEHNSLSYETQAMWIQCALAEARIHSSKATHTMHGAVARIADAKGVPEDQICRAAGSTTPSVHSLAPDIDDSGAPIRISSDLVGTGFEAVKIVIYQSHLPEYPKTDNAGFGSLGKGLFIRLPREFICVIAGFSKISSLVIRCCCGGNR